MPAAGAAGPFPAAALPGKENAASGGCLISSGSGIMIFVYTRKKRQSRHLNVF